MYLKKDLDKLNDIYITKEDTLDSIKFNIENYTLVYCYQKRTMKVNQNIYLNYEAEKTYEEYHRIPLSYNDQISLYDFEDKEMNYIQKYLDKLFYNDYKEIDLISIKDAENLDKRCTEFRKNSIRSMIRIIDEKECIMLPRYINNESKTSLLDGGNIDFWDDVYGNSAWFFKKAFLNDAYFEDAHFIYGYYDYEMVKEFIIDNNPNA